MHLSIHHLPIYSEFKVIPVYSLQESSRSQQGVYEWIQNEGPAYCSFIVSSASPVQPRPSSDHFPSLIRGCCFALAWHFCYVLLLLFLIFLKSLISCWAPNLRLCCPSLLISDLHVHSNNSSSHHVYLVKCHALLWQAWWGQFTLKEHCGWMARTQSQTAFRIHFADTISYRFIN